MDKSKKSVYKYFIAINMMRGPSHLSSLVQDVQYRSERQNTIAFTDTTAKSFYFNYNQCCVVTSENNFNLVVTSVGLVVPIVKKIVANKAN